VANAGMRDARIAAIDKELLEPALSYLRQSEGAALDAPAYAQGLIALYDRDYAKALECAREAERQVPWLYEARLLAGDALFHRAQAAQYRGEFEKARADLEACGLEYEEAAVLARSAPEVYVSLATRWVTALELTVSQGKPAEADLQKVLEASAKALEADPENADALNRSALAHWRLAEHYQRTGGNPVPPIRKAMAACERILMARPDDAKAHFHMGSALSRLAEVEAVTGADPEGSYRGAIEHLGRSLNAEPDHPFTLNNLGLAHWRRGQYRLDLGKDPTKDLDQAAEYFQRASSALLAPVISLNRGNVFLTKAMYERDEGKDPTASLEKAVEAYGAALALNPKEAVTWSNLASAQFLLGEWAHDTGGNPLPRIRQAEQSILKTLEVNPKFAAGFNNLSNFYQLEGDYLAAGGGQDPLPVYGKALEAMGKARTIKPDSFRYVRGTAELNLRCAVHALRSGRDAGPDVDRARPDAQRASEMNPRDPDVWGTLAEYHLMRARWLESVGKPTRADVEAGLAAAAKGLSINPKAASLAAHRAFLLALRAEGEADPAAGAKAFQEAREASAFARTLHPDAFERRELDECEAVARKQGGRKTESQREKAGRP
jgi:serine/threonine-protein kinase